MAALRPFNTEFNHAFNSLEACTCGAVQGKLTAGVADHNTEEYLQKNT
jgi:hypothetical protein